MLKMEDEKLGIAEKGTVLASNSSSGKVAAMSVTEWDKLDQKARGVIRLCLSNSLLVNIASEKTAKDLWKKLESLYQSKSLINKLILRKKLYKLSMNESDSFSAHLHEFNTVISQLLSISVDVSDEDKAIILLCSLPDSWDNLIVAIGSGTTVLSFENVVAALLSEEMRRQNMGSSSKEALSVRGRAPDRNQKKFNQRSKSKGRSKSRDRMRCWKCQEFGHLKRDCKNKDANQEKGKQEHNKDEDAGDLYIASACVAQSNEDVWYVDTGALYHVTSHRNRSCEYEAFDRGDVMLDDDTVAKTVGR